MSRTTILSCILFVNLIGQHQNKRFYVMAIIWPHGFSRYFLGGEYPNIPANSHALNVSLTPAG